MPNVTQLQENGDTLRPTRRIPGEISVAGASISSAIVEEARAALERDPEFKSPKVRWRGVEDPHAATKDRLVISVAIGGQAQELLACTGPAMEEYAKRCGAQFTVLTEQTQTWWGLEKFRVGAFAKRHQQTLFLDADIFVRRTAPNLFDAIPANHVATSVESDELEIMNLRNSAIEWARNMRESQGETAGEFRGLNSGVVLCDSATAQVWTPPTEAFEPFHTSEQAWIERNVEAFKLPFYRLHWKFNCQHWWPNFNELVSEGEFVHLSGASHDKRLVLCKKLIAGKI